MARAALFVLIAILGAPPAGRAAEFACMGRAMGAAGEVAVNLVVRDGRVVQGWSRWAPRIDPSSSPGVGLMIDRPYIDPTSLRLGPVAVLRVVNVISLDPPPVDRAIVTVSSNLHPVVGKTWTSYNEAVEAMKRGETPAGVPAGSTVKRFTSAMPFGRAETGPLLDSLTSARTVITVVGDHTGQKVVNKGLFWLDAEAADGLAQEADRLARIAAAAPEANCRPPQARPAPG